MIRIKTHEQNHATIDFRPEVKNTVAPTVKKEFFEDGKRMYITKCGRTFIADVFDRNFKTTRTPLMPKNFKGENADYGRRRN